MDTLTIGVLGKPRGVHGDIRVRSYSGEVEHFRSLRDVVLLKDGARRPARVREVRVVQGIPVLRFEGVETPEVARSLAGWEISVPRERAAPLGPGEYYWNDLVDCRVTVDGVERGRVVAVVEGTQAPLLEVAPADETSSSTVLIPFMSPFVGEVDIEGATIIVERSWILE
ncbi:MAG: ribosome maturation factor RimM [Spirochaetales bacterium]|nr:ribosome maturation factor RimM [Spirochaetales bacterium]